MLRIGQIEYANCTPIFYQLKACCSGADYEFVSGVPAELNRLLAAGGIDVCPSSSIEYALHPGRYRILPQLSISSVGAVASVLLFSRLPIEQLDGKTILLSSESATSVNLLKVIMAQLYGSACHYSVTSLQIQKSLERSPALLLIGDSALRASLSETGLHVYDLGKIWYEWTGLPFVFALWLCRAEVAEDIRLKKLARQLIEAKNSVPLCYGQIAESAPESGWMGRERLMAYWRDNISYNLEEQNITGLLTFFEKCRESDLIPSVPELNFTGLSL